MHPLIQFIVQHWQLFAAFIIVLGLLILFESYLRLTGAQGLSAQGTALLCNRQEALILDIRDRSHFTKSHIANSINIPLAQLYQERDKIREHQTKPIIISYLSGQSYQSAVRTLRKAGFNQLYYLKGGINAWSDAGFPLTQ